VDILELGVPFSDPLADGLVNQLAAQRGLESGTTPPKLLETIVAIRKQSQIPVVLYIYFNLIHKAGLGKFIADCAKAGVDGLLVLDLPPEESDNYEALMKNPVSATFISSRRRRRKTAWNLSSSAAADLFITFRVAAVTLARVVVRPLVGNRAARMLPRLAGVVPMKAKL
jgi:tryptophan synthase alpha subunit